MLRGPSLHLFRLMGPQPIHDQEDLSGRLAQHSLQERNKPCGRHRLFVGHEVDRSLVANRRDQVHADVGTGHLDPRRPSLAGVAPQTGTVSAGVAPQTGTVSDFVLGLQPIMPLDLPVKVRSWELTVYPRSHIRRWFGVTRPAQLKHLRLYRLSRHPLYSSIATSVGRTAGSGDPRRIKTFGRPNGGVGRPSPNQDLRSAERRGRETLAEPKVERRGRETLAERTPVSRTAGSGDPRRTKADPAILASVAARNVAFLSMLTPAGWGVL